MRRPSGDKGSALILLLGITATLAILATTAVVVLGNQQRATAAVRSRDQSFDYAEAGLDSAVMAVRTAAWPAAGSDFAQSSLRAAYDATYPSGSRPTLTVAVYDNQATVNQGITWDKGGPTAPSTPDGRVWVEASVTLNGKTSSVRTLVGQVNSTGTFSVPAAAIYTDGDVIDGTGGSGNAYAADGNNTPILGAGNTPLAAIYAGGKFVGNWSSNLRPSGSYATLDVKTNGTVYNPALTSNTTTKPGTGGVQPLSSVLPQSTIDTMTAQARQGDPTKANAGGTVVSAALISQLQLNQGKTTTLDYDLVVNGNLNLQSGTANFRSLYVTGNLTVGAGGAMHATALYVGGTFTVSGTDKKQTCGPIWVGGNVSWNSNCSVETTDYLDAGKEPASMYVVGSFTSAGGPFSHVLGPTYIGGAVTFSGNQALIACPLLVTPGQVTTSGSAAFGTIADPMVLVGPDVPGVSKTMQLGSNGTFTGLVINMDGPVTFNNSANPDVRGAVFSTGTVTFSGNTKVCYDPTVLANLQVTAGTTTTSVVPGTWQELPAN